MVGLSAGHGIKHFGQSAFLIISPEIKATFALSEVAFEYLDGPVTRVAGPDVPAMPYSHGLEAWFMIGPERITDAIRKLAAY